MEFRFYSRAQVAIITTLLFISAFLMFSIQPLTGKTLLPQFGGVPAVWNTCMVFFQALLLIGYTYVFLLNKTRSFLTQAVLHLGLIGITCFYLPINLTLENEYHGDLSAIWLFIGLFLKIGAPLFIISSTAPILQMWFARTRHKDAEDPYYLYVASNFGSMAALLLYPLLIEHYLTLNEQRLYWTIGYVLLAILVLVAAIVQARLQIQDLTPEVDGAGYIPKEFQVYTSQQQLSGLNSEGGIGIRQRLLWVASACVPSSVLLGVSTHITTDIAPIPMLWVIPLGIYLLTFILAFARKQLLAQERLIFLHTMALAAYLLLYKDFNMMSVPESILIHLFILFTSAYICHQTLVRYRPTAKHLPDFYLCLALGGFLGGAFNNFIAPLLFASNLEYPIMLAATCVWLRMPTREAHIASGNGMEYITKTKQWLYSGYLDIVLPIIVGGLLLGAVYLFKIYAINGLPVIGFSIAFIAIFAFGMPSAVRLILIFTILILLKNFILDGANSQVLYQKRSFFGMHKVVLSQDQTRILLFNGNILHGEQEVSKKINPVNTYYTPLQGIFAQLPAAHEENQIGVVGLGVGTIACYFKHKDSITFYEIDPTVVDIAYNPQFFNYLEACKPKGGVIVGDGRLNLAKANDDFFDLLVMDAYHSDAVPIHLLTKEAVKLYLQKIKKNGIIAFHVSNIYLDLRQVLAAIAKNLDIQILSKKFVNTVNNKQYSSAWVVLAPLQTDLHKLVKDDGWMPVIDDGKISAGALWTDGYSNLWSIFRF